MVEKNSKLDIPKEILSFTRWPDSEKEINRHLSPREQELEKKSEEQSSIWPLPFPTTRDPRRPLPFFMPIDLLAETMLHLALMLEPAIPPAVDNHIKDQQDRLQEASRPAAGLDIAVATEIDHLLERVLDLHRLLVAGPAPQVRRALAGAVRGRDSDPHAHVRAEHAESDERAVLVRRVGGLHAAHVRRHHDRRDDEGHGGCD